MICLRLIKFPALERRNFAAVVTFTGLTSVDPKPYKTIVHSSYPRALASYASKSNADRVKSATTKRFIKSLMRPAPAECSISSSSTVTSFVTL